VAVEDETIFNDIEKKCSIHFGREVAETLVGRWWKQ
jgi:hypothetical protein